MYKQTELNYNKMLLIENHCKKLSKDFETLLHDTNNLIKIIKKNQQELNRLYSLVDKILDELNDAQQGKLF